MIALSDAGWAAVAAMFAACLSTLNLVLVTLLRKENRSDHAAGAQRQADLAVILAQHAEQELARYDSLTRSLAERLHRDPLEP